MKKLFLIFSISFIFIGKTNAQSADVKTTLQSFPYQKSADVSNAIASMQSWGTKEWKSVLSMLNDDSLKLQATYALNAYVHAVANDAAKNNAIATTLASAVSHAKTYYAKQFIATQLSTLGNDVAVKPLAKLLKDEAQCANAAIALGIIKSNAAIDALKAASSKLSGEQKKQIDNVLAQLNKPASPMRALTLLPAVSVNPVQHLLQLQDRMEAAKNPLQKKAILAEAAAVPGFSTFIFVSKSLQDPEMKSFVAPILARLALADKAIRGEPIRKALETAIPLIKGEDSAILVKSITAHLKALPYDNGFVSLFNGKDLTGWKGLVGNPVVRAKMSPDTLQMAQMDANDKMYQGWTVKDGLLVFTGHGDNLCTVKKYGDFEMYVDWKITEKGDAGIYLRGSPQVQIWDTSRREVGAQVGSGGLYNNQKNMSKPLVVADNKIGQWNTFHITMQGEKVTVYLNGQLVVDNVTLENYWDRNQSIFPLEQLELQAHGTYVAYRNIYVREIKNDFIIPLNEEEKKQGFVSLFDGSNLDNWVGNKEGYHIEDGAIVVDPSHGGGGNLYTKDEYADFSYKFEFQLTPGANNGIGIRAPLTGDAAYVGMEIQVLDSEHEMYKNLQIYQYHGSVYGVIPARRGFLKPTGEWNQEEIIAKGNSIKVILNGQVIVDGDIKKASENGTLDHKEHPGLKNTTGHIGFLGHGDVVRFRNIRIKKN